MSNVPPWLEDESENRKKRNASKIAERGVDFFAKVVSRLEANVEHVGLAGAQGRLSNLTRPNERELRYRLDMRVNHGAPSLTYTDLFYTPGTLLIRYQPRAGGASDFQLCLMDDDKLGVVADGEFVQTDATAFADWIVKSAVERLREAA